MKTLSILSLFRIGLFSAMVFVIPLYGMQEVWHRVCSIFKPFNNNGLTHQEQKMPAVAPQVINAHTNKYTAHALFNAPAPTLWSVVRGLMVHSFSRLYTFRPHRSLYEWITHCLYPKSTKAIADDQIATICVEAKCRLHREMLPVMSAEIPCVHTILPLATLPRETSKIIWRFTENNSKQWYKEHSNSALEGQLIPCTMRSIKPVKVTWEGQEKPQDMTAIPGEEFLLDEQLFHNSLDGDQLRLCKDTCNTNDIWRIPNTYAPHNVTNTFFDGINNYGHALFAGQTGAEFAILHLKHSGNRKGTVNHPSKKRAFFTGKGVLSALTLHDNCNRFVCAGNSCFDNETSNSNSDFPYFITIGDLPESSDDNYAKDYAMWSIREHFKKIIPVGKNTYVGHMQDDRLASIAHYPKSETNSAETIDISVKNIVYSTGSQTYEDFFEDIAVDNSYQTQTGFKPRMAFLNKKGMVFVTDFCFKAKPTLLLTQISKKNDAPARLFYDEGKIGLFYKKNKTDSDEEEPTNTLFVWQDNLDLLCLGASSFLSS